MPTPEHPNGDRLPFALAPLSLGRPDNPWDLMDAAAVGGFRGVGMTLRTPEGRWQSWCRDKAALADVRAGLAERGLSALDVGITTLDPECDLDAVRTLAEAASALGATHLVLMCRDPDFDRATRHLADVGRIAADAGQTVAVEFMPYTAARDLHAADRLVRAGGQANVGILFDLFQHVRSGLGPEDIGDREASRVVLIQLSDGTARPPAPEDLRREALTDRLPPGEGAFPLAEILARLPRTVPVTVEAPCRQYAALPPAEQARLLGAATRRFLEQIS